MRLLGRVLAWIVLVVAVLATLLCVAIAIDNDGDSDLIGGGIMFAVVAAAIGAGAWAVQRALDPDRERQPGDDRTAQEKLERAARGETVVLRPRRLKWIFVLLVFGLGAIVMLAVAMVDPGPFTIGGAIVLAFVSGCCVWALTPGGAYLRISPEGLESKMTFRTQRHAWNDVENFRVFEVRSRYSTSEFVGFDLRDRTPQSQSFMQTVNRGVSGVDVGLPDNYGLDPEELAGALNELRERHATEHGVSPSERADRELRQRSELVDKSRRVVVTWVTAAVCVGIYVWEVSRFDFAPTAAELLEIGGATAGAEPWTLLTGNVLHADVFHLGFNLIAWAVAGVLLEREIGAPRMSLLALVAGVASMGLAVLLNPQAVTVGLSGVVFAALAWGVLRDVHRVRALGQVAWAMLPIGVIYTFLSPGTSIGGHLGGLAAGLLLGWSLDRARGRPAP